jgi:hypothetical protein
MLDEESQEELGIHIVLEVLESLLDGNESHEVVFHGCIIVETVETVTDVFLQA